MMQGKLTADQSGASISRCRGDETGSWPLFPECSYNQAVADGVTVIQPGKMRRCVNIVYFTVYCTIQEYVWTSTQLETYESNILYYTVYKPFYFISFVYFKKNHYD